MKNAIIEDQNIHVGQIIKSYLTRKRIFKSALARRMGKNDNEILRYQKLASVKSEVLIALSVALEHNFFADLAALLPKHYSTDAPIDNTATNRIEELELKVKLLEAEKGVLLEAMRFGRS